MVTAAPVLHQPLKSWQVRYPYLIGQWNCIDLECKLRVRPVRWRSNMMLLRRDHWAHNSATWCQTWHVMQGFGTYSTLWKHWGSRHKEIVFCSGSCNVKTEREKKDVKTHCRYPRGSRDLNKRQLEAIDIGRAVTMYIFGGGWER
jgi:hypothetical protein